MSWRATLRTLVERQVGIVLRSESDHTWLRHVERRIVELGLPGPAAYVELLVREPARGPELTRLLEAISNTHTWFFRDLDQLEAISDAMGELSERRSDPLEIWCAGCATGEEPYSLAILCQQRNLRVRILATDMNGDAIRRAEEGRFSSWALRRVPDELLEPYFRGRGEEFEISAPARQSVRFQWHNLVRDPPPRPLSGGGWDLVVCRNVLIYFAPDRANVLVQQMASVIEDDGLLVLGAGDMVETPHEVESATVRDRIFFRRRTSRSTSGAGRHERATAPPEPLWAPAIIRAEPRRPVARPSSRPPPTVGQLDFLDVNPPDDIETLVGLAYLRLRSHDFDETIAALEAAEKRDGLLPEVHYLTAVTLRKLGRTAPAARAASRALFLAPDFWQASFLLANLYRMLDRGRDARREFSRALQLLEREAAGPPPLHPDLFATVAPDAAGARRVCEAHLHEHLDARSNPLSLQGTKP